MSGILSRVSRRFASTWHKNDPVATEKSMELWKKISIFGGIPAIFIVSVNTYLAEKEHEEHFQRPEFIPYEHMHIINTPFPWGDGKHPLFFNKKINATRAGYED